MGADFQCRICPSSNISRIETYKHFWFSCDVCGNIFRVRRDKHDYLIPKILPRWIAGLISRSAVTTLYPVEEVIAAEEKFYDYYQDASAENPEATKWGREFETLMDQLSRRGVDVRDKRVLDISGGPGFVAKSLQKVASRIVVTEYSPRAVEGMIRNLQVDARKFDYATDQLSDVVDGTFDVVLIRYSINFCPDLARFVTSLRRVLADGGLVYVTFVPPTLGCCLRWQFDEYTYNILYQPETMDRLFSEGGFIPEWRGSEGSYDFCSDRRFSYRFTQTILPYKRRALRSSMKINRELIQKNEARVYRKSPGA